MEEVQHDGDMPQVKQKRGFALLTDEQRQAIARKGGRRAHALGTAYRWNSQTATLARQRRKEKSQCTREGDTPTT